MVNPLLPYCPIDDIYHPYHINCIIEKINIRLRTKKGITFEERNVSQFKWFQSAITHPRDIFNLGCSYGRETFALLWFFNPGKIIGFDLDEDYSKFITSGDVSWWAEGLTRNINLLLNDRHISGEKRIKLLKWEKILPVTLRKNIRPVFCRGDITKKNDLEIIRKVSHTFFHNKALLFAFSHYTATF